MLHIDLDLPNDLVWAFAELLKRAGYSDYRQLAVNEQEAYDMQEAAEKIRTALAKQGCAPR